MLARFPQAKTSKKRFASDKQTEFYDVVHLLQFNSAKKTKHFQRLKTIKKFFSTKLEHIKIQGRSFRWSFEDLLDEDQKRKTTSHKKCQKLFY